MEYWLQLTPSAAHPSRALHKFSALTSFQICTRRDHAWHRATGFPNMFIFDRTCSSRILRTGGFSPGTWNLNPNPLFSIVELILFYKIGYSRTGGFYGLAVENVEPPVRGYLRTCYDPSSFRGCR